MEQVSAKGISVYGGWFTYPHNAGTNDMKVHLEVLDETDGVFLTRREDRTRSAGLTLSHRKVSWEGYQPVLMLDWSRTESNVPL